MHLRFIQRLLGVLIFGFGLSAVPPIGISLYYADGGVAPFVETLLLTSAVGLLLWFPARKERGELRLRDGFLIVAVSWIVMSLISALPLIFARVPTMTVTDAVFEAVSGLTTTGATVIVGLDVLPKSILYFRQQTNWLGGMGIIVLAVAILPMLGVGGMSLYRAETPGPIKDNKLKPRITETAKTLWFIYIGLTLLCAVCYWLAGMSPFDAIGHAFAALATGGFSTYDASIAHFDSAAIDIISIVFMLLAGINFSLHFVAWRERRLRDYFRDPECRLFVVSYFVVTAGIALVLVLNGVYESAGENVLKSAFQVASVITNTGFTTASFSLWPTFVPALLMFVSIMGGCAGSTAGGMKVMRILLLFKQGFREIARAIHPNATIVVKMGDKPVPERVTDAVWGFFAAYVAIFVIMMLLMMATGLDQVSAFSAVVACINNLGPGLGEVASNFVTVSDTGKWLMSLTMIMGRLEIFTILVLFTPTFWRR